MKTKVLIIISTLISTIAWAQSKLSPAQLQEDFNQMMEQYERIHPNPTWSLGGERYNELKRQTLERLDRPMTQLDFWRVIAQWNQHFDGHTRVGFPQMVPQMPEGMMVFPPMSIVQYRDGQLRFSSYEGMPDSLRGCEITAVDGHRVGEIVDSIMPYVSHESGAYMNATILRSFSFYYNLFYGYSRQMTFRYMRDGAEKTVRLDRRTLYEWLVQVGDHGSIGSTGPREVPWHFKLFPEQDIALFEFNTCGPYDRLGQFDSVVSLCIDSINRCGIGHLFVDLSHNGGGWDMFCQYFLCHIGGLPDTAVVMDVTSTEGGTVAGPEEKRVRMSFHPKQPLYGGRLYFIQSRFTYSAPIMLVNTVKRYGLGTLVGEETGGLTTTYSWPIPVTLPNSGLKFHCSDRQYRHLGTTGPRGVMPDIPLEIGYKYLFRGFEIAILQEIKLGMDY